MKVDHRSDLQVGTHVILVRAFVDRRPPELAGVIAANIAAVQEHLDAGAIAVFSRDGIRVGRLPLR